MARRGPVRPLLRRSLRLRQCSRSARWISRLAKNVWLSGRSFLAVVQMGAQEIAALPPAAAEDAQSLDDQQPGGDTRSPGQETAGTTTVAHGHPADRRRCGGRYPKCHSDLNARQPRTTKPASGATARSSGLPSQRAADDGAGDSDDGGLGATPPGVTAGVPIAVRLTISRRPRQLSSRPRHAGATVGGRRLSRIRAQQQRPLRRRTITSVILRSAHCEAGAARPEHAVSARMQD